MSALWPSLLPFEQHGDDSRCAVSARGVRITFADGHERLCMTSGLWNVPLGYGNPAITAAIAEAADRLSYGAVFRYENRDAREAANAMVDLAGADRFERVLFSTGGGAANDLLMKLARQYHGIHDGSRRPLIVGLQGSFHGMTFGAFSLTGEELGQDAYSVDRRFVRHLPPNDVDAFERFITRAGAQVAAVVVEPVSGSGTEPLEPAFIEALGLARERHGFLLVADEVATGFARTGPMFASSAWPVAPDVMLVSKALTNGTCAIAGVLVSSAIARTFQRSEQTLVHAETAAGNAIASAAISATIAEMRRLDLTALAHRVTGELDLQLAALEAETPSVLETTGAGAFRTVRIAGDDHRPMPPASVPALVDAIRHQGVVVHPGVGGIQLVPPLVSTHDDIREALDGIRRGVEHWQDSAAGAAVS